MKQLNLIIDTFAFQRDEEMMQLGGMDSFTQIPEEFLRSENFMSMLKNADQDNLIADPIMIQPDLQ